MRKFTKDHNDLGWLFPNLGGKNIRESEEWFDFYEELAKKLYNKTHKNNDNLTEDDIIDSFMKGASIAHQQLVEDKRTYEGIISSLKKQISFLEKENNKLRDDK